MTIVGCDCYPSWQQVAVLDKETSEIRELKLTNGAGAAEKFYRSLPSPSLVGFEGSGNTQWFEDLLARFGHVMLICDAAKIRASYIRRQKDAAN
jgi:transposase